VCGGNCFDCNICNDRYKHEARYQVEQQFVSVDGVISKLTIAGDYVSRGGHRRYDSIGISSNGGNKRTSRWWPSH
jgi:hypothetical protein